MYTGRGRVEFGDGHITKDEFYGSVVKTGTYAGWYANDDGLLDKEAFGALGTDWDYDTCDVLMPTGM